MPWPGGWRPSAWGEGGESLETGSGKPQSHVGSLGQGPGCRGRIGAYEKQLSVSECQCHVPGSRRLGGSCPGIEVQDEALGSGVGIERKGHTQ